MFQCETSARGTLKTKTMLTKEQLLMPRYKVIATYPQFGMPEYEVGFIFDNCTENQVFFFKKYPHLFKELAWHEERSIEDMPQYYHYSGNNGVFKTNFRVESASGIVMLQFEPTETLPVKLEYTNPATEQEYNDYIKTKK